MFNKTIGFRVNAELQNLVKKVCKDRGEDVSDFVRRAMLRELASLNFLPESQKKALGMKGLKNERETSGGS